MAENYSVEAVLSVYDKGFTAGMKQAADLAGSLNGQTQASGAGALKMGGAFGIASALVGKGMSLVQDSVGGAISRFDTLNKYPVVMKALGYSAQDVAKSTKALSNGIDGLPTSLDEITASAQQLAPLTGSANKAAKSALALNNAFLASGASVADTSRGLQQYTQMLSTGKVDMMSWRTLMETMPIALRKVANSFGYTGKSAETDLYEALKSGKISVEDLNNAFIKLNKGQGGFADLAKKNSAGIGTSFANLRASVVKNLGNMLTAVNDGFAKAGFGSIAQQLDNLKGVINSTFKEISPIVTSATTSILNGLKPIVSWVGQNKNWLTPMAKGVLGFIVATKGIGAAASGLNEASTALTTFGSFVTSIREAQGALATFKVVLGGFNIGRTFLSAGTAVKTFISSIKSVGSATGALNGFKTVLSATKNGIVMLGSSLKTGAITAWNGAVTVAKATATGFKTALITMKNGLILVGSALKTGALMAWNAALAVVRGTMSVFSAGLNLVKGAFIQLNAVIMANPLVAIIVAVTAVVAALVWFFTQTETGRAMWQSFTTWLAGAWQSLVSIATTVWNAISSAISTAWNAVSTFIMSGISVLVSIWSTSWNLLITVVSTVWNAIVTVITTVWNTITSVVSSAISAVSSIVTSVFSAISSFLSGIMNSISSIFTSGWNKAKSITTSAMNAAKNAVTNAAKATFNAGKNFVMGFVRGITGFIGQAASAAARMAKAALSAAKGALGIHSPSRVMRDEVGYYVGAGMAKGILGNASAVEKASEELANKAVIDPRRVDMSSQLNRLSSLGQQAFSGNYSGSMQLQDSSLQMQNNALLRRIAEKGTDLYLDGRTLVGGTLDTTNEMLGNQMNLKGRWN